uniref:Uncharacterized protein n=1 Tax=Palpitomonas bilix TaxID=652834 RepID=A0A7S3G872_9EUKA|mmetsp:Transcript_38033/g.98203  ORF Transcript_38033/g.98203 Transcript_38033/m.98203 type:complete len:536 (+) Transcript_38033:312-1919(+)
MDTSINQGPSFMMKPLLEGDKKVLECRDVLHLACKQSIPSKRQFNLGKQSQRLADENLHYRNNEKAFSSPHLSVVDGGIRVVQTVTGVLCLGSGASGMSESWMLSSLEKCENCYEGWSLGTEKRVCEPKWKSKGGSCGPETSLALLTLLGKSLKCVSGLALPCLLPPRFPSTIGEQWDEKCFSLKANLFAGEPKSEWMKGSMQAYPGFDPAVDPRDSCDRCYGAMSSPQIEGVTESQSGSSFLLVMLLLCVEGVPVILNIPPRDACPVEGRYSFEVERTKLIRSIAQLFLDITGSSNADEGVKYAQQYKFSSIRMFANVTPTATQCRECLKDYVEQFNGDKAGKSARAHSSEGEKRQDDKPFHAKIQTHVGNAIASEWHLLFRHGRNVVREFKNLRRRNTAPSDNNYKKRKHEEHDEGESEYEFGRQARLRTLSSFPDTWHQDGTSEFGDVYSMPDERLPSSPTCVLETGVLCPVPTNAQKELLRTKLKARRGEKSNTSIYIPRGESPTPFLPSIDDVSTFEHLPLSVSPPEYFW